MTETTPHAKEYADTAYVEGVFKQDPVMERALYNHCKRYFDSHYKGVFFVGEEYKDEIFQESFITLWKKIMDKKIYVEDGVLKGKNGTPFSGQLATYFMSIAKLKNLEWVRSDTNAFTEPIGEGIALEIANPFDSSKDEMEIMIEIVAECLSQLTERCDQIITMFYVDEKTLDDILKVSDTFKNKDSLKTAKYKCLETLRKSVDELYSYYLNA